MKYPAQEDLLGYVLGALDADEHRQVRQLIEQNPALEKELLEIKASLRLLDHLEPPAALPTGLARRAAESVALHSRSDADSSSCPDRICGVGGGIAATTQSSSADSIDDSTMSQASMPTVGRSSGWSVTDLLVGVGILGILVAILLPAINYSRFHNRLAECQNNIRSLGSALAAFSVNDPDGEFPHAADSGRLAVNGSWAVMLMDAGYITDHNIFSCAGVQHDSPTRIPTPRQIDEATGESLVRIQQNMSGDFGYTLGFFGANGAEEDPVPTSITGLKNLSRPNVIVLADQPSRNLERRRSNNHAGYGQNVLFEDGRVEFVRGFAWGDDPIFENDFGVVGPGANQNDNVIGPSHLTPIPPGSTSTPLPPLN